MEQYIDTQRHIPRKFFSTFLNKFNNITVYYSFMSFNVTN